MSESLDDYDFHLPDELIAQTPVEPRDSSRLLVVDRKSGRFSHRTFRDLTDYLGPEDLIVVNNTKVLKARLLGRRIAVENPEAPESLAGKVEFLMLEETSPRIWEGLFHASAKYLPGVQFLVPTPDGRGLRGKIIRASSDSRFGTILVEFDRDPIEAGAGEIPLPKYIRRGSETFIPDPSPPLSSLASSNKEDLVSYQTVYSKELGSAAAPTAGLHFTEELIQALRKKGVEWAEITLHVGVGTFRPVKTENISEHVMHEERYHLDEAVARRIEALKLKGTRITAVGTTSVRTLESAVQATDPLKLKAGEGRTSIFLRPGHGEFRVVDRLITNFHLPKSTLLMLVSAFAGRELILSAYEEAVRQKYRFFSYGDAMLIL